jgi:hypothetical protein
MQSGQATELKFVPSGLATDSVREGSRRTPAARLDKQQFEQRSLARPSFALCLSL